MIKLIIQKIIEHMIVNRIKLRSLILLLVFFACVASDAQAQTVFITKTGTKYHKESCRYLRYSKVAITLKKAKDRGYQACKVCKPPQALKNDENSNSEDSFSDTSQEKKSPLKNVIAKQCSGTTKAGLRCKRITKNTSGKCWQHE